MMSHTLPALAAAAMSTMAQAGFGRVLRPVASGFRIREERSSDVAAREALLDRSFGPTRHGKTSERLREGRIAPEGLSFVAVDGAVLVGTLRFWQVEAGRQAALLLGPLAVDPAYRSAGIGRAMISHGLKRARALGHEAVILVGDAPYYARFGFRTDLVSRLVLPGPVDAARFLGLELLPGSLAGAAGRVVGAGLLVERGGTDSVRLAA